MNGQIKSTIMFKDAWLTSACFNRLKGKSFEGNILEEGRVCVPGLRSVPECLWWHSCYWVSQLLGFPGSSDCKVSAYNAGDLGSIPRSGRLPGEGNGIPLQYSCLENPMDRGAWWATAHGVAKSWTRLSDFISLSHLSEDRSVPLKTDPRMTSPTASVCVSFGRVLCRQGLSVINV